MLETPVPESSDRRSLLIRCAILAVVWALLYLPHLRTSPGWYGDETLTHVCSRDLAKGQPNHLALWNTYWHPHYPYQPGYTLLNGICANLAGGDILGSRLFNATLALAIALLIAICGPRTPLGMGASFFGAVLFLCYSQSVIHFRMSYAHNAVGAGITLLTLYLLRPPGRRNDLIAGAGLAIAAAAHPLFVHAALSAGLVRLRHPRSWIPLFLPAGIVVGLALLFAQLRFGHWLWEDLDQLRFTFTQRGDQDGGGSQAFANMSRFIRQDWFHTGAALGLVLCLNRRLFPIGIVGGIVLFLLVKNRQNLGLFYYQAVVILPVLCLAWSGFYVFAARMMQRFSTPRMGKIVAGIFWIFPVASFVLIVPDALKGTLKPRNYYWVTQSTDEVEHAAAWLNERTVPTDTIAGNATISWLLKAQTVPYLQMVTWYGQSTQGYDHGVKRERFRFDASLENVKYAVVGDIDQRWTIGEPHVKDLFDRMEHEKWQVVWQGQYYFILANPKHFEKE